MNPRMEIRICYTALASINRLPQDGSGGHSPIERSVEFVQQSSPFVGSYKFLRARSDRGDTTVAQHRDYSIVYKQAL